jgi:hypothetical protein
VKLLKLILIIFLFFQAEVFASGKHISYHTYTKADTLKNQQKKKRKTKHLPSPPKPPSAQQIINDDCVFTNKYSIVKRLKYYPFSKAVKILAVSYHLQDVPSEVFVDTSKLVINPVDTLKSGLHIKNGRLNYSSLIEVKTLSQKQVNDLTTLIYNTNYRKPGLNAADNGACFNPRNALIFYDKNGKVFDYIQICFECLVAESLSNKVTIGTLCNQKYTLLKKFFINAGIRYGTINGVQN